MKYDTATPHTAAYVIMRQQGKLAFVLRQNTQWMNGYYGLPSGKIEKGESAVQAAIREAKEEVGVTITPDQLQHVLTGDRHDEIDWIDICFEASGWEGEPYNAEPHIHSELSWLDPDDLPENIIPSVRFYIEQIQAGKTYSTYGWPE
jgi:8-oxo-dGTP diphosphatase